MLDVIQDNKKENLQLAFDVAEKHLGIPQLLDPNDIVDIAKPDERSIITYVSLYYHVFSQSQQGEVMAEVVAHLNHYSVTLQLAGRRIGKLVDFTEQIKKMKAEYNDRARALKEWIGQKDHEFTKREFPNSLDGVQGKMGEFKDYKVKDKSAKNDEKVALEAQFNVRAQVYLRV